MISYTVVPSHHQYNIHVNRNGFAPYEYPIYMPSSSPIAMEMILLYTFFHAVFFHTTPQTYLLSATICRILFPIEWLIISQFFNNKDRRQQKVARHIPIPLLYMCGFLMLRSYIMRFCMTIKILPNIMPIELALANRYFTRIYLFPCWRCSSINLSVCFISWQIIYNKIRLRIRVLLSGH